MGKAARKRVGVWLPWAGVLGLLALLVAAVHPSALIAALRHANLWLLVPVLGCSLLAMALRGVRWHLLLRAIDAPNTLPDSLILFTAAQAAQLVPGGQLLLPVLQRSQFGTLVRARRRRSWCRISSSACSSCRQPCRVCSPTIRRRGSSWRTSLSPPGPASRYGSAARCAGGFDWRDASLSCTSACAA